LRKTNKTAGNKKGGYVPSLGVFVMRFPSFSVSYRANLTFQKIGKNMKQKTVICSLLIFIFSSCFLCQAGSQVVQESNAPSVAPNLESKDALEIEKLKQEVFKVQLENENLKSSWTKISSNSAFFMAITALIGIFVTIWKQRAETSRLKELDDKQQTRQQQLDDAQRQRDSEQRQLDREQRERENQRLIDQKFTSIIADLSAESEAIQASAAVLIITYLKPEYEILHDRIFAVLLANLKITHSDAVNRLISEAFEKALRIKLSKDDKFELNISRTKLIRLDLEGLDFSGIEVDIAFADLTDANLKDTKLNGLLGIEVILNKAKLSRAELKKARLNKAQCEGAHFHNSVLISATLKGAILKKAEFMQAQLQAAHFEGADLTGAKFENANINDTYFNKAILDDFAKKSLIKAKNWKRIEKTEGVDRIEGAHFDDDVLKELLDLESKRHQTTGV
jgi:uncharacterized protein YjbI with pentapeptide repeats